MAIIMKKYIAGRRCWLCGLEVDEKATITYVGDSDILYLHPPCAQTLSQQIMRDLSQLIDFGFNIDELDV